MKDLCNKKEKKVLCDTTVSLHTSARAGQGHDHLQCQVCYITVKCPVELSLKPAFEKTPFLVVAV